MTKIALPPEEALPARALPAGSAPRSIVGPMALIVVTVVGCSLWSNLSTLVTNPNNYRFFPPFQRWHNPNHNDHLGAEYNNIAGAIVAGRGFADPFHRDREPASNRTGPTAWMAPMLAWILAALRFVTDNDKEAVIALFVLLEDVTLIGSGLLIVLLARRTVNMVWTPAFLYVLALACNFRLSFQFTHDCWLVLAYLNLIVAGLVWCAPLDATWKRAFGWGIFGGLCALTSPIVGFAWGVMALAQGWRRDHWARLSVAALAAMLTISPWVIRNYIMFGRLIPVKSNLSYELYQSQCLTKEGVLDGFHGHPYVGNNPERRKYKDMGEMAFLDEKNELFWKSVKKDPLDFAERVASRFFAATLVYTPMNLSEERQRPVSFFIHRALYPLPFIALLFLVVTTPLRPLAAGQWIVIGVYMAYLMPYVLVSFYDRYKYPLLAVEVLLVAWGLARIPRLLFGDRPAAAPAESELADLPEAELADDEPVQAELAEPYVEGEKR